jgi:hypothetical protein
MPSYGKCNEWILTLTNRIAPQKRKWWKEDGG